MRGERLRNTVNQILDDGSSPHARGTRAGAAEDQAIRWFIPACAGNAAPTSGKPMRKAVHPRMRGERMPRSLRKMISPGSSPHARGTRVVVCPHTEDLRFIPACAGNAGNARGSGSGLPVHPRMRGERCTYRQHASAQAGSSPHARGTHSLRDQYRGYRRFIPACAGNAAPDSIAHSARPVHPRMRGERTSNKLLIYRRKSEPSDSTKHSAC